MDVFEQQQAHRPAPVERRQPGRLCIQRVAVQQLLHEGAQLLATSRRQRRVVAGIEQFLTVLPQFFAWVVQQHADQFEQAHFTTS
ncbi:hypothetical protein D3C81_1759190 [compost metagenome]